VVLKGGKTVGGIGLVNSQKFHHEKRGGKTKAKKMPASFAYFAKNFI